MGEFEFYDNWKTASPYDLQPGESDPEMGTCRRCERRNRHLYPMSPSGYAEVCGSCQLEFLSESKRMMTDRYVSTECATCRRMFAVEPGTELPYICHICMAELENFKQMDSELNNGTAADE